MNPSPKGARSHLRLVVNNEENHDHKILIGELEDMGPVDIAGLYDYCIGIPISEETDGYFEFMRRNWEVFDRLFRQIEINEKVAETKTRLNYFIMLVYIHAMRRKYAWEGQAPIDQISANLLSWVNNYSEKIVKVDLVDSPPNSEEFPKGPGYFKGEIKRVLGKE